MQEREICNRLKGLFGLEQSDKIYCQVNCANCLDTPIERAIIVNCIGWPARLHSVSNEAAHICMPGGECALSSSLSFVMVKSLCWLHFGKKVGKTKVYALRHLHLYFFLQRDAMHSITGTALKEWSCQSMGWTAQNWSVRAKCASSSSLKRCCSYWMWKMQSSTWTSLFWAFSSSSFGWPPTLSSATKLRQSDRFSIALLERLSRPGLSFIFVSFHCLQRC